MEILVTGRLASISSSFYDKLTEHHKVITASDDLDPGIIGRLCTPFKMSIQDEQFNKLFISYSFQKVIYFTDRPEEKNNYFLDFQDLETTLRLCSEYDVKDFLCISSTYVYDGIVDADESTIPSPVDKNALSLFACEQLCEFYRKYQGLTVMVLHTPCLFGHFENKSIIGNMLQQIADNNHVLFQSDSNQHVDFLAQEDLGELVVRIFYEQNEDMHVLNVKGISSMTFAQLGEIAEYSTHTTRVSFSGVSAPVYPPMTTRVAQESFDWFPVIHIEDELLSLSRDLRKKTESARIGRLQRIITILRKKTWIMKSLELVGGYFLMEYLNILTDTSIQYSFIDFRLLFVVLLGVTHGIKTGFIAASLASLSCIIAYADSGTDWRVILYNIDYWLPFIAYFLVGSIIGHIKDKYTNDLSFVTDEKNDMQKRYVFLNELYLTSLQNKGQFKKQIVSYRDSFGRIFEITKRLNTVMPDLIFKEALLALEDVLENHTVSIYSKNEQGTFMRLSVCSKKIFGSAIKSLDLMRYPMLKEATENNTVWVNKKMLEGYPDYAFPVYHNDSLILLIMLQDAAFEQMAMYYANTFKILCSLIETSLLRALEHSENFNDEMYIPGTKVMQSKAFKDILRVREEMGDASMLEYSLISIDTNSENIARVAEEIHKYLRYNDVMGESEDGKLHIILTQTSRDNIPIILERFKTIGSV